MGKLQLLRRPGLWIGLVLVLGGLSYLGLRSRGPLVETTPVVRRDLEQHLVTSGRVWVSTRIQVAAQAGGLVQAVFVKEGAEVKAGTLLVQLDDAEAQVGLLQGRVGVEQANAKVEQLRRVGAIVADGALRQAEANLRRAEKDLARYQSMAQTGAVAPVDVEKATQAVELARAQQSSAEAQQLASAPLGADSRVVLTALLQAKAQLAAAELALAQTKIFAPIDALVITRQVEPGDQVVAARTLLVLAAGVDQPQLLFQSDERNLRSLHLGQRGLASADAYPDQRFEAEVAYLAPSIDPERGTIEVRLRLPDPPNFLLPDMTVSIDLTVAAQTQVLTLPSDAVRNAATGEPWVYVAEESRVLRKAVKLGIRGEGAVELASGLAEGEAVILPDDQQLSEGQRVRTSRRR